MSDLDSSQAPGASSAALADAGTASSGQFISPHGKMLRIDRRISEIVRHPEFFGIKAHDLEHLFQQYHEPVGSMGSARQEILIALRQRGWLRVRRYPEGFTVKAAYHDLGTRERITAWAQGVLEGAYGEEPADRFTSVRIKYPEAMEETDLGVIADFGLFSDDEPKPEVLEPVVLLHSAAEIPVNEVVPVELPH
jgi:hypothetical protein